MKTRILLYLCAVVLRRVLLACRHARFCCRRGAGIVVAIDEALYRWVLTQRDTAPTPAVTAQMLCERLLRKEHPKSHRQPPRYGDGRYGSFV